MNVQEIYELTRDVLMEAARRDMGLLVALRVEVAIPSDDYLARCIHDSEIYMEWAHVALVGANITAPIPITTDEALASIRRYLFSGHVPADKWLSTPFGALYASAAMRVDSTGHLKDDLITVTTAAKRLGVTPSAISQRIQRGTIRAVDVPQAGSRIKRMVVLADVVREEALHE